MLKSIGLSALIGLSSLAMAEQAQLAPQVEEGDRIEVSQRQISSRIPALMAEARQQIEALEQDFTRSGDDAIQHEIMRIKQETELRRLELLADECRLAGRLDEADRADAERARLLAPAATDRSQPQVLTPAEKMDMEEQRRTTGKPRGNAASSTTSTQGGAR